MKCEDFKALYIKLLESNLLTSTPNSKSTTMIHSWTEVRVGKRFADIVMHVPDLFDLVIEYKTTTATLERGKINTSRRRCFEKQLFSTHSAYVRERWTKGDLNRSTIPCFPVLIVHGVNSRHKNDVIDLFEDRVLEVPNTKPSLKRKIWNFPRRRRLFYWSF